MSNKMYYIVVVFAFDLWYMVTAQNHCRPKDCYDLGCYGVSVGEDGPHTIYPDTPHLTSLEVSCDQETHNGGWIIYQRRVDGTVNFTRNWKAYQSGFGTNGGNTTELWLGNENVYQLLQSYGNKRVDLRFEVDAFDGDRGWIESSSLTMRNEAGWYRMSWGTTTASNTRMASQWDSHKSHSFKTLDKLGSGWRCLKVYKGGWWYEKNCGQIHLNGEYINWAEPTTTSIFVQGFKSLSLKRSRMMFRMTNDSHTCNNPCRNGAACEHLVDTKNHRCVCKFEFCGPECELANPCANGGTCEYDETAKNTTCKCSAEFSGPMCQDAVKTTVTTTPPTALPTTMTTTPTTVLPVVGGILLLFILIGVGVATFVIYKRRQRMKQKEEEEAAK